MRKGEAEALGLAAADTHAERFWLKAVAWYMRPVISVLKKNKKMDI